MTQNKHKAINGKGKKETEKNHAHHVPRIMLNGLADSGKLLWNVMKIVLECCRIVEKNLENYCGM